MNINFFEMVAVKAGFVAFALAMGLVACGDEGSTNGPSNGHNDSSASFVESEGDLPNCTESGDGSVSFVDGTKEGFVCKDRKWLHYDMIVDVDENLPGCTGSREGLTAYLYEENRELKCVEGAWGAVGEEAGSSSSVFPSSSSSVIPGTAPESGSSVADKANWAYLNPNIDYGTMTDTRDGQVYKTVTIGSQTWMAENLNYNTSNSYCYDNNASNCSKYGRLYTWSAAMNACPSGWHLPSDTEWNTLWIAVGGTGTAGMKLKSTSGWSGGGNGTDSFGFAVLPAGRRSYGGYFSTEGDRASFWSSSEFSYYYAYDWYFYYDYDDVNRSHDNKDTGFSVRCLKDSSPASGEATSSSSSQTQPTSSSSNVIPGFDPESSSSSVKYGSLTDSRDGQTYKTVTIGTQTWMAENLNYAYKGVKFNYSVGTSDSTSWCNGNKASNCDKYGRLYTWSAVMDSAAQFSVNAGTKCGYGKTCTPNSPHRGICPEGWHVPTNEEYSTLYTYIGGSSATGSLLKSTSGWSNSGNGTDKYGFSVLPAGFRFGNGVFDFGDYDAYLWSASEDDSDDAWYQDFYYGRDYALQYGGSKDSGRSLRCLKDS
ncbi:fibrobacter succinogenes major paralogous domain-containing protein [Fibrobacter sp. UWH5]|uniref:fibrobacter succinogenes major paralogous domain-containing protein n=1 Tax=Fibrobacter sp. UWH5 TaxID=1896211 RepID=UPI000933155B|nr:fibrobacter succinogenes major paralogous domain-containing protein [Fibrobacter sp. UWH5]